MRLSGSILCGLVLCISSASLGALPIHLIKEDLYVRQGFQKEWLNRLPAPEDIGNSGARGWLHIKPAAPENPGRAIRMSELGFAGTAERKFLSMETAPPRSYTLVTTFELDSADFSDDYSTEKLSREHPANLALYIDIIGINWEIYLNGHLVRREVYRKPDGGIEKERNLRRVFIPLDSRALKEGRNILAYHIIGDPLDINTGIYRGVQVVDTFQKALSKQQEIWSLMLLFLYLFVGLYHLFLFAHRPTEPYNLFFGLFAVVLFFESFTRTAFVNLFIEASDLVFRLEVSSIFLLTPILSAFLDTVFRLRLRRFTILSAAYTLVFLILIFIGSIAFMEDLLQVWFVITMALTIPFLVGQILIQYAREVRRLVTGSGGPTFLQALWRALTGSIGGNLLLGILLLAFCALFDILDSFLGWHYNFVLLRYGFLAFVGGTAMILANYFLSMHNKVRQLNEHLEQNIEELDGANRRLSSSEEKYRQLVEGTDDIVFSLNSSWRCIAVNKSIRRHLGIPPEEALGMHVLELIHPSSKNERNFGDFTRSRLEEFRKSKKPMNLKLNLTSRFNSEPVEFLIRLEYSEGKDDENPEILGKGQRVVEDSLLKYLSFEKQMYELGNYLTTTEELSQRLVRNLERHLEPTDIMPIRIALREILINAIEHGNLGISYDEKSRALQGGSYQEFLFKRQKDARYSSRKIRVQYILKPDQVVYTVEDEGAGFDHKKVRSRNVEQINAELLQHGRGIMMTEDVFDEVLYNQKGNHVTLSKNLEPHEPPEDPYNKGS